MPSSPPSVRTAKQGFVRAIAVLVGGTAAAHAVTALAMPILSRLYAPADFGALAVLTAIVSTIGVVACLRYDVAVALPGSDEDSLTLLTISLASAAAAGLLACAVVAVFFDRLVLWLGEPALEQGKWLIPVGIFCFGSWNALQSWHIRKQNFGSIAKARLGQALATSSLQMATAAAGIGTIGLLAGPAAGLLGSIAALVFFARGTCKNWAQASTCSSMKRVSNEYRKYPTYSTWEAFANQASIQLPIVLIAGATNSAEAGHLALAMYALQAPLSLLGTAIGQVFLSKAPQEYREGNLNKLTTEVTQNLVKIGAGPIIAIGILSPIFFPLIFGSDWERAGWLVAWMTPWFLLQFIASPISMVLHVVGAQSTAMNLQVAALLLRLAMTIFAIKMSPELATEAYAISGAVTYLIYAITIFATLKTSENSKELCSNLSMIIIRWTLPFVIAAALVVFTTSKIMAITTAG